MGVKYLPDGQDFGPAEFPAEFGFHGSAKGSGERSRQGGTYVADKAVHNGATQAKAKGGKFRRSGTETSALGGMEEKGNAPKRKLAIGGPMGSTQMGPLTSPIGAGTSMNTTNPSGQPSPVTLPPPGSGPRANMPPMGVESAPVNPGLIRGLPGAASGAPPAPLSAPPPSPPGRGAMPVFNAGGPAGQPTPAQIEQQLQAFRQRFPNYNAGAPMQAAPGAQRPGMLPMAAPGLAEGGKFIQGMHLKKGALHRELGVPEGEKIPESKLKAAASGRYGALAQKRAHTAETLKGLHHGKRKD